MMNNQILDFAFTDTFDMYDTPLYILVLFIYSCCLTWDLYVELTHEILPGFVYVNTMMHTCQVEPYECHDQNYWR